MSYLAITRYNTFNFHILLSGLELNYCKTERFVFIDTPSVLLYRAIWVNKYYCNIDCFITWWPFKLEFLVFYTTLINYLFNIIYIHFYINIKAYLFLISYFYSSIYFLKIEFVFAYSRIFKWLSIHIDHIFLEIISSYYDYLNHQ